MENRSRAWRRYKTVVANKRHAYRKDFYSAASLFAGEKNWKQMYGRTNKIHRAFKLGFDYPIITTAQLLDAHE